MYRVEYGRTNSICAKKKNCNFHYDWTDGRMAARDDKNKKKNKIKIQTPVRNLRGNRTFLFLLSTEISFIERENTRSERISDGSLYS